MKLWHWLLVAATCLPVRAEPTLLRVPDTRQSTDYTCSAAALQAVLGYYGIDAREGDLSCKLGCKPKLGAPPEAIVRVCQSYGLQAELRQNVSRQALEEELKAGRPVIVDAQAWRDEGEKRLPWAQVWESGHYMVAIGLDSERLYLEDPSLLGSRGVIPWKEFEERWHDYETNADGKRVEYHRAAIFMGGLPPRPPLWVRPVE